MQRMAMALALLLMAAPMTASAGEIEAKGAASDDFGLHSSFLTLDGGGIIERDRMYMAARPGFLHKDIPLSMDAQGNFYAGGVYLFDTEQHAAEFSTWLANSFELDGTLILNRDYFIDPVGYSYKVIGAYRFEGQGHTEQVVFRSERWKAPDAPWVEHFLKGYYHAVKVKAHLRGYTEVWLLYNAQEDVVNVVYFDDRADPSWQPGSAPDFASLNALADDGTMGLAFDAMGWQKTFDRTSWVLTTWFPFVPGDQGAPSTWPNSPPFASPEFNGVTFTPDGICEPSRGENSTNAPGVCLPTCGNAVVDPGEDDYTCPADVPYPN